MTAVLAAILFWTGCCGMLFGAFLALTGWLTHETVADKGQGGETGLADHRSRRSQGFALHDEANQ